jgi:two-component system nitrate/nitrite response regulator NarL
VTIKMHVRSLAGKMGAKNRTHAAMMAREKGLV